MNTQKLTKLVQRTWRQWRLTVFFIVFIVIPAKSSLADWYWVPTGSMNPTILEGDMIFVNKAAYDLRFPLTLYRAAQWSEPERGDIVVCFSPEDGTRLVKRVIGLPGDTLEMKDNRLVINSRPVRYSNPDREHACELSPDLQGPCVLATEHLEGADHLVMAVPALPARRDYGPLAIPAGYYFVLGDNRDCSRDSRFFGLVERKLIVGKAKGTVVSFDITDKYQPRLKRFFEPLQ